MSFSHDRRGQSVVVGTVILFGFLILALSLYQVQFVPAENEEIEFEHSQQVEGEFLDLRNAVLQAGSTGSAQSTRIQLGERYPQRTFFLNPPPAAGTLQTTDTNAIEVNGQIGDGAHENVQAFWETDPQFNSTSIRYTSNYNEYRGAPQLVYEHSVVAAEFDDAVLFRSDQTVVRNDRISVTALSGDISETGVQAQSVDLRPISRSVRTVPITGDGGDVEIVLPTAVDNTTALRDRWATTLPGATVTEDGDAIRIALNGSETYRLGLSAVAVDGGGETEPAYIVPVGGTDVVAGDSIGVEVRDEYNNPVADVPVSIDDETFRTGDEGRVFTETSGDGTVDATINGGSESYEEVVFTVTSTEDAAGANRTFSTQWDETGPIDVPEGETRDLEVEITDRETGNPIEDARIDYSIARRSGSGTATLNPTTRENHDGTDTIEFDASGAVEGDSYDAYVSAGDDVDVIQVDIIEESEDTTQCSAYVNDGDFTLPSGETCDGDVDVDGDIDIPEDGVVNGDVTAEGDVTVDEGGRINGNVVAQGEVSIEEDAIISGSVTLSGNGSDDLTVGENAEINGNVVIDNNGSLSVSEDGRINGNVTLNGNGDVTVNEDGVIDGDVTLNGNGEVEEEGEITGDVNTQ